MSNIIIVPVLINTMYPNVPRPIQIPTTLQTPATFLMPKIPVPQYIAPQVPIRPIRPIQPTPPIPQTYIQPIQIRPLQPITPIQIRPTQITPLQPMILTQIRPLQPITQITLLQPITQITPLQPVTPIRPLQPVTPIRPLQPVTPIRPLQPVTPIQIRPLQPVTPIRPLQPVTPIRPLQPITPIRPLQPVTLIQITPTIIPIQTQPIPIHAPPKINYSPPRVTGPVPKIASPKLTPNIPAPIPVTKPNEIPVITEVPNLDSPEQFVNEIIGEQNADIMEEKDYLGIVSYLLNEQSKYEIFTRLFPEHTCPGVHIRLETIESQPTITPYPSALVKCIQSKEKEGGSVAVNLSYGRHANLVWFDTVNKIINRYDPQVSSMDFGQDIMDDNIREYLTGLMPDYAYLGNTLESWQCVQGVRAEGRAYKADYFCQDYSLLYAINRINGMSHEDAAFSLVGRGEDVLIDLAELLRFLAYRVRAEMGKDIPERYHNWKPGMQT